MSERDQSIGRIGRYAGIIIVVPMAPLQSPLSAPIPSHNGLPSPEQNIVYARLISSQTEPASSVSFGLALKKILELD